MTARTVRVLASAVCVAGIAGMIASAVAASTGAALTFGLLTATAVLCSIVATAVTGSQPARVEDIEDMVRRLVKAGADETDVRELVARAKRLGRSTDQRRSADASPTVHPVQPELGSSPGPEAPI